jgi:hypothetical protein
MRAYVFRSAPNSGHCATRSACPFRADFVAEIGVQTARDADAIFCSRRFPPAGLCGRLTLYFTDACNAYAAHKGAIGGGRATNLASLRRFCAIAANVNSNWAPHGPRNRSRPSRRIRFKCANSISTRFLSRDDCLNVSAWPAPGQRRELPRRYCAGLCGRTSLDSIVP